MFLRIAHRGASAYEPENTLRSFSHALRMNINMIECDVHICKTGELVIMHDETVSRTTNGKGKIHTMTYKELYALDDGKGEHIPKVQEVIELVNRKVPLNIELKGEGSGAAMARVLAGYYASGWRLGDFVISSFSKRELLNFRKRDNKTPTGFLSEFGIFPIFHFAKKIQAVSVNINHVRITRHLVEKAHKKGFRVYAYTVDTPKVAERMREIGVDGVYSDCPDTI